jgi:hypothetical protein
MGRESGPQEAMKTAENKALANCFSEQRRSTPMKPWFLSYRRLSVFICGHDSFPRSYNRGC